MNLVGIVLHACILERRKTEGGSTFILNDDTLEYNDLKFSVALYIFTLGSVEDLMQTWKEHLAYICRIWCECGSDDSSCKIRKVRA
jgi:hypothetical protein